MNLPLQGIYYYNYKTRQPRKRFNYLIWLLLVLFLLLIFFSKARSEELQIKKGMFPNEVNKIMQINPDYEFIRGNFYNTERYFIWEKPKPDFILLKGLYYKTELKFNSSYLWITFLKDNDEWKVFEIKELQELSFKPYYETNGRNFFIIIPKGENWIDFPKRYSLNWIGLNIPTWYDKCGEPDCYNNCIKK